jgi:Rrf2 family transcriptional regulator, nitric oxide-sensitive transcriptional repressor
MYCLCIFKSGRQAAMKLTTFTDYSLRVLIYLAADTTRRATIAEIAAAFGISENHLVKVVHFLGKQGWVKTLRGKGGGILLAMPPAQVNVGHVVRDTEGAALPAECFAEDGGHCAITRQCRLMAVLGEAVAAFYAVLDEHTLADITRNRQALGQVLMMRAA